MGLQSIARPLGWSECESLGALRPRMYQRKAIVIVAAMITAVLTGCAVGPRYNAPAHQLPKVWQEATTNGLATGEVDVTAWWQSFEDPVLSELVSRAADGNLDLRMAVLRIRQARALRGIAAGALLPTLSGDASVRRTKPTFAGFPGLGGGGSRAEQFTNTMQRGVATAAVAGGIANVAPGAAGIASPLASGLVGLAPARTSSSGAPEFDLFAAGFDAAWELDVFGGLRRGVEAADADLAAALEDFRAVQVSLLAEVATTYIDVRTLQAQIAAARRNIALQEETLGLTNARLDFDLASELEVRQAETNLATTESLLPALEAGLATAIYRLSVLVGEQPGALKGALSVTGPIPRPPRETFVGVPAEILRRRPDLRAAERRLASATAQIGVAAANLYPRFSLTGSFGVQSSEFDDTLDSRSITYGFGPAVRWNIFDGLRNLNRIAAQEAVAHHAYVAYEQALLLALQDVETAMVNYKREQVRRNALDRAAEAARRTVHLAETRYEDGLTDFQDVVDAQRSLVNLETSLVESQGLIAMHLVALYKALGGGWTPESMPQAEYLEAPSELLADPMHYFLTGGKTELPWSEATKGGDDGQAPANTKP